MYESPSKCHAFSGDIYYSHSSASIRVNPMALSKVAVCVLNLVACLEWLTVQAVKVINLSKTVT